MGTAAAAAATAATTSSETVDISVVLDFQSVCIYAAVVVVSNGGSTGVAWGGFSHPKKASCHPSSHPK